MKIGDITAAYDSDWRAMKDMRNSFDEKENFILGNLTDKISKEEKNQVNDQSLLSTIIKRTNSTMAQLPTGTTRALSKKSDAGKSLMMSYILTNYIEPNACSQYDLYTKWWMVRFLSYTYGTIDILPTYVVSDKYVGPDFYIIPPRNGIPQAGKYSINECERYFVRTSVSEDWLKSRKKLKGWNKGAIDYVIKNASKDKDKDAQKTTATERSQPSNMNESREIELVTMYEGDKSTIFHQDLEKGLKETENKDGEIPVVSTYCFPLLDRYHGLGEYERLGSIQKAQNGLINIFMKSELMRVDPPLKVYLQDVVARTLKREPGSTWLLKNNNPNAIMEHQMTQASANNFQQVYNFLKGSMLSASNSTDTSTTQNMDVTMGKTPQALKMQEAMDSIRTNFDRKMLESSISKTYERFINMIATRQEKPIKFSLFGDELDRIKKDAPDVVEMFESGQGGEVTIKPSDVKGSKYRFFIDAGSTMKKDEQIENSTLTDILTFVLKMPGAVDQIATGGEVRIGNVVVDVGEAIRRWVQTSGTQDAEKIVRREEMNDSELPLDAQQAQKTNMQPAQQPMPMQPQQPMPAQIPMAQPMSQPMSPQQMPQPANDPFAQIEQQLTQL